MDQFIGSLMIHKIQMYSHIEDEEKPKINFIALKASLQVLSSGESDNEEKNAYLARRFKKFLSFFSFFCQRQAREKSS